MIVESLWWSFEDLAVLGGERGDLAFMGRKWKKIGEYWSEEKALGAVSLLNLSRHGHGLLLLNSFLSLPSLNTTT